jgi:hypothetical protein
MHIILGALGSIVTILFLLHRLAEMGIDFGGLNPFSRRRRRAWRQKFDANPVFALEDPRDIAGVLVVGVAKLDGDMSADEKRAVLDELEKTISLAPAEARELVASSVYLIGDGSVIRNQLGEALGNAKDRLSASQSESLVAMIERIGAIDGPPSAEQRTMIDEVRTTLLAPETPQGTWN